MRTIKRFTAVPHRGRQVVLIIPGNCDVIGVRLKGTRKVYDIPTSAIFDVAVKMAVAAERAAKKAKKGAK